MNNNFFKIFSILTIITALASCSNKFGDEAVVRMYNDQANLVVGKTSLDNIKYSYHYPEFTWKDKAGNKVNNYHYSQSDHTFISYLPYISIFTNRTKVRTYDVTLTFDQKDLLKDKFVSYKEQTCKNIFDCRQK